MPDPRAVVVVLVLLALPVAGCVGAGSDDAAPRDRDAATANNTSLREKVITGRFVDVVGVQTPAPFYDRYERFSREGNGSIRIDNLSVKRMDITLEWEDPVPRVQPSRWGFVYGILPNNIRCPREPAAGTSPIEFSIVEPPPAEYVPDLYMPGDRPADYNYQEEIRWTATIRWGPTPDTAYDETPGTGDPCP